MFYRKLERSKSNRNFKPSPTFSVESHDKWSSRYIWALDSLHEIHYPDHFITLKFGKEKSAQVDKFKKKLRESITNKNSRKEGSSMAYFGVFEILQDFSVHAHLLVRGLSKKYLEGFLSRYNKKNGKNYTLGYCEETKAPDGASRYSFKLGYDTKILFQKNSLKRYTITGGKYFPKGIKHYRDLGRVKYFSKK